MMGRQYTKARSQCNHSHKRVGYSPRRGKYWKCLNCGAYGYMGGGYKGEPFFSK